MFTPLLLALILSGPTGPRIVTGGTVTNPNVTIAWNAPVPKVPPSIDDTVTGYRLLWGTSPGSYPHVLEIPGVVTQVVFTPPASGTYYFVLEAENDPAISDPSHPGQAVLVSDPSAEISTTVVVGPPPECVRPLGAEAVSIFLTRIIASSPNVGTKATIYFQLASQSAVTDIHVEINGQIVSKPLTGTDSGGIWFVAPLVPGTYFPRLVVSNAYGCTSTQAADGSGQPIVFTVSQPVVK